MAYNDRAADHKIVKMTKHFIGVSDSDADSFGQDGHNAGNIVVNFLNPNLTNISSSSDATKTIMNPLSLQFDVTYNNVSQAFRNNRFRVRSMAGNVLRQNGINENGSNPANAPAQFNPVTFPVVIIPDGVYKTGEDLGTAILAALNTAAISWLGGNQIVWTNTNYDATTQSIRFRYATAAAFPVAAPELFIDSVYQDPNTGISYDSSRVLGTTGAEVGPIMNIVYTDGAFKLPYATTQGAGAGVATPAFVDLQTIDVIQLRSNCAKRYYRKQGTNAVAGLNPLSFVPVLFEIPLDTAIGGSFYWQPQDNRYSQEINSNFETLTLQITDKFGRVVPFNNNAEMNYQFVIEREIIVPSNEERVKAMSEYNRFKSF